MKFRHGDRPERSASFPSRLVSWPLSLEALGLFCSYLAWSVGQEEDGFVPTIIVEKLYETRKRRRGRLLKELVGAGLVEPTDGGLRIPLFAIYNETKAERRERQDREARRAAAQRLRPTVIARDGLVCHICGGDVEPSDVHIDHVHALSRGGSSDPENLKVAHSRCNLKKGAS